MFACDSKFKMEGRGKEKKREREKEKKREKKRERKRENSRHTCTGADPGFVNRGFVLNFRWPRLFFSMTTPISLTHTP